MDSSTICMESKGESMTLGICPRCNKEKMRTPQVFNCLSRCTRSADVTAVYVCNQCGTDEAFEEYHTDGAGLTPMINCPIESRVNQDIIDVLQVQYDIMLTDQMEELL